MNIRIHSLLGSSCSVIATWAIGATLAACSGTGPGEESLGTTEQAATVSIAITGTITGAQGAPVAGVVVHLNGREQATATTDSTGAYAFNGLVAGSYSVQPMFAGCTFDPTVENLGNVAANTTVDFAGSGSSCGGAPANAGAQVGAFTLSGTVVDTAHRPVSGVLVTLAGTTQGVRTTTASGTYSFQVNAGSYSVMPSGVCTSFAPTVANLNHLSANETANFTGIGCPVPPAPDAGSDAAAVDAASSTDASVTPPPR
jgi:hypothetical protein